MLTTSAKFLGIASKAEGRWRDTETLLAFGREKKKKKLIDQLPPLRL